MATTQLRGRTTLVQSQTREVSPDAIEEVAKILGVTADKMNKITTEKVVRRFNSNLRENVKLANFFNRNFTLPSSFSQDVDKAIDRFSKATENFEITRVDEQRALLSSLGEGLIDQSVQAMENTIKGIPLSEEQREQAAERLDQYRKFLTSNVLNGVKKWEQVYGTKQ